jgi:hypothetical protein
MRQQEAIDGIKGNGRMFILWQLNKDISKLITNVRSLLSNMGGLHTKGKKTGFQ